MRKLFIQARTDIMSAQVLHTIQPLPQLFLNIILKIQMICGAHKICLWWQDICGWKQEPSMGEKVSEGVCEHTTFFLITASRRYQQTVQIISSPFHRCDAEARQMTKQRETTKMTRIYIKFTNLFLMHGALKKRGCKRLKKKKCMISTHRTD